MDAFMQAACREATDGIHAGHGGPFGAVIVRDGQIIGQGHNCVLRDHDPTAHGEVMAIRAACHALGTHNLAGAVLYTTAEPCPMCLGAILWAGISEVRYGCTRYDTAAIGFRDSAFYEMLGGGSTCCTLTETDRDACLEVFSDYQSIKSHTLY